MNITRNTVPARGATSRWARSKAHLLAFGPGLVVMLADTDVGSILTAAQSGVRWGYQLLALQLVLIPILYIVQELAVRLGIFTGKGHGELIRETFGPFWAWVAIAGLLVAVMGALVTEFSGIAGVGEMFGMPRAWSISLAALFLLAVVWTGTYRRVERIAIALGLFELVFVWMATRVRIDGAAVWAAMAHADWHRSGIWFLVSANIGAVIMPWMVFYQQSAVADKQLVPAQLKAARWDTAIGAVVTQAVMAAVLVMTAATLWTHHLNPSLTEVGQLADALQPFLGTTTARAAVSLGILGAALVAAIVVALAAAWGLGEVTGYKHSLACRPHEAPWFYLVFTAGVVFGAVVVALVPDLVALSVDVEVMNALLLPVVLGFLVALAVRALPPAHRLRGGYLWLVVSVVTLTCALGLFGSIYTWV